MVKECLLNEQKVYLCEKCGLGYAETEAAEECEAFCAKHRMCSLEITRKAIYKPEL